MSRALIEKELTQGVVPIGTPKAYQYDQALVESAVATVIQGLQELGEYTEEKKSEYLTYANTILTAIQNQYGYPFVASTVSAMTDVSKIYVYTGTETGYTAGNWYYNDGTDWVSGGVFNSDEATTKAEMSLFGIDDLLWDNTNPATTTTNGVTWTVDKINKAVTVSSGGQASTGDSYVGFYFNADTTPAWLTKGKQYYFHIDDDKVYAQVAYKADGSWVFAVSNNKTKAFVIPATASGLNLRLFVPTGTTVNTVVRPFISESLTLDETLLSAKSEMAMFGIDDLLWDNTNPVNNTQNGVTGTVDTINKTVTVTSDGVASTGVFVLNFFYGGTDGFPSWLQKEKEYYAHIYSSDSNIKFHIIEFYEDNSSSDVVYYISDGYYKFKFSANAVNATIRLYVPRDSVVNGVAHMFISETLSLGELGRRITTNAEATSMFRGAVTCDTDFNTLTKRGDYFISSNSALVASETNPLGSSRSGILQVYKTDSDVITQVCFSRSDSSVNVQRRYSPVTDAWTDWIPMIDVTKPEVTLFGIDDLYWNNYIGMWVSTAGNGVTFYRKKYERTITVDGSAETASVANLFHPTMTDYETVWNWLEKGKKYYLHNHTDADVQFQIMVKREGEELHSIFASTTSVTSFILPLDTDSVIIRLFVPADTTLDNVVVRPFISEAKTLGELTKEQEEKSLKILFIGHSTVQDGCTYVPWILQNVAPELDLTMGIAYKGSTNISDGNVYGFNSQFDNPDFKIGIYSVYESHANSWSNSYDSMTVKDVLDDKAWDVVVVAESVKYDTTNGIPSPDTSHYAVMAEFIDKIVNYVQRPLKFGAFFNHTRYCTNDYQTVVEKPTTYEDCIEQYKDYVWDVMPVQFFFPNITAYWNARGTTLDQYGNAPHHHMLADYAHYQEGIGCYLGSCTTALRVLEIAGINDKSILGNTTRPTTDWVTAHAIPGQNYGDGEHVSVGISDANCLIAQKCAIMAIKKPWEISVIL